MTVRPTFARAAALAACLLVAACLSSTAATPPAGCGEAAELEAFLDRAGPSDTQTATDLRALIESAKTACADAATTTTEAPTTEPPTSSPSTTETPSTEPPTTVPATTTPPTTQPPAPGPFPTAATTGVPAGWTPTQTITDRDLTITTPGTVVQDVRMVRGNIWVRAANVTIRRVEMQGGRINNSCCINQPFDGNLGQTIPGPGLTVEDTTFANPPGVAHTDDVYYRLGDSNYTARRVKIVDQLEGFRTGGRGQPGAGEVTIEDSYVALDTTTIVNTGCGGHPDGVQGYSGEHATIRHNTLDITGDGDCKNGAVFIADSSNGADVIDNLLEGGAFTLRANDGPFRLIDNMIQDRAWQYGPLTCGGNGAVGFQILEQHGNHLATVNSDYEVTSVGRTIAC